MSHSPSSPPRRHLRLVTSPAGDAPSDLTIDCDSCAAQFSSACDDCFVSYLVGHEQGVPVTLDHEERRAVDLLADAGLVPPSRFEFRPRLA